MTVSSPPLAEAGLLDAALGALLRLGDGTADRTAAERDRAEATELRALRTAHPGRRVRFLHQREVADGSVARALLLTCEDRGTISLSWTPPSTVPWVLRGARRSSESVLLSVDGVPMTVEDAMAHLDVLWGQTALLDRLVNAAVVQRVLSERPVSLSAAQLQSAVDAVRRSRGLLTAEATRRWLDERGLTHGGLERLARWEAELAGLRDRVTAGQVPGWLAEHPGAGVRVRCTTVTVDDPALATRLSGAAATGSLAHAAATALLDGAMLEVASL